LKLYRQEEIIVEDLINYFEKSNREFIDNEREMILRDVSEVSLCSSFKDCLMRNLPKRYKKYSIDLEYNRNIGNTRSEKHLKTIINGKHEEIRIKCDLIIHSRGVNTVEDNILALEMKKSYRTQNEKDSDRARLIEMTKKFERVNWKIEKNKLPEYICGYKIGIYYEIDSKDITIEYYISGTKTREYKIDF